MSSKRRQFDAWIRRGDHDTPLSCAVMDMSAEGATIFAAETALPNRFTLLLLSDGSAKRRCEVVSRDGFTAVTRFIE